MARTVKRWCSRVVCVAVLAGCTGPATGTDAGSGEVDAGAAPTTTPVVALQVQPSAGSGFLTAAIGSATSSVDVAAYILTEDTVEQALAAAAGRGVTVRVMFDPDQAANASARTYLSGRNVQVRNGPARFLSFHQKTVVVDGARAFIMTLNPSFSAFHTNREYSVEVTRAAELADLSALFEADWTDQANPAVTSALVVSPNNARSRLLGLIRGATAEIIVCVETFSDNTVAQVLKTRKDAGLDVKILMAHPADVSQNQSDADTLRTQGFSVRFLRTPTLHAKLMAVDGTLAYLGSVNFTRASMDQNREIGVVIDDPGVVGQLRDQALADWAVGVTQ